VIIWCLTIIEIIKDHTMSLEANVMNELKDAMKAKDEATLRSLRAIKSEIIKAKTEPGANGQISLETELKLLQRMAKQRRDSLEIFQQQNRHDLAIKEEEELAVIERFLPKQLSPEELKEVLMTIINDIGATTPNEMGKVMAIASKQLAGRAEGRSISAAVKDLLANM
jgi:uncharacterized protein YqeY